MDTTISLFINHERVTVPQGASVAVAVLSSKAPHFRRSISGEPRAALCGMGICFECRVTINGVTHARSCQIACEPEMRVSTDAC